MTVATWRSNLNSIWLIWIQIEQVRDGWSANGAIITTQESVQSIYSVSDKIRVSFKLNANIPALYSWIVSEVGRHFFSFNYISNKSEISKFDRYQLQSAGPISLRQREQSKLPIILRSTTIWSTVGGISASNPLWKFACSLLMYKPKRITTLSMSVYIRL